MDPSAYFLPDAADVTHLSAWSAIIPASARIIRTNLFGDAFMLDEGGAVHMLERGACCVEQIAPAEEDFWKRLQQDEDGWQLRPLVDECRLAGKVLGAGQCYAFITPPVFREGSYAVENVGVASWKEWFSFTADLFQNLRGLPDGAKMTFEVTD